MSKPFIFVSCGQFTTAEKALGKAIVKMVKDVTGLDAFFAEEVQDLNGLDSNILNALRACVAFITVLHPRGTIARPDKSVHIRASVWIEQEIAIATYIQHVEKRQLRVIAFLHESVGLEGIRSLLHLNPIPFSDETDVLAALPARLMEWRGLTASGIRLQIQATGTTYREGHWTRQVVFSLVNDSAKRITSLNCQIDMPAGLLKHWSSSYVWETKSDDQQYRRFRFDEKTTRTIAPRDTGHLMTFDTCSQCAAEYSGPAVAAGQTLEVKVWIDDREYSSMKTVKELAIEAEERGLG